MNRLESSIAARGGTNRRKAEMNAGRKRRLVRTDGSTAVLCVIVSVKRSIL
jgi:hypothetical protein